jgi:hypothetical protein
MKSLVTAAVVVVLEVGFLLGVAVLPTPGPSPRPAAAGAAVAGLAAPPAPSVVAAR